LCPKDNFLKKKVKLAEEYTAIEMKEQVHTEDF
jgi:hypothetical protein